MSPDLASFGESEIHFNSLGSYKFACLETFGSKQVNKLQTNLPGLEN